MDQPVKSRYVKNRRHRLLHLCLATTCSVQHSCWSFPHRGVRRLVKHLWLSRTLCSFVHSRGMWRANLGKGTLVLFFAWWHFFTRGPSSLMAFSFFRPCGPSFLKLFSAVAFLRPWFFRPSWAICFHSILDCVASPMPSLASPLEKILVGRDEFSVVVMKVCEFSR